MVQLLKGINNNSNLRLKIQNSGMSIKKSGYLGKVVQLLKKKKLLGCSIDSQIESIICLAPKCYSAIDEEVDNVIRMK
ncbi:MAG: hypothetical protein EZS28_043618 [Streblomastix strix]|uniref:Uncharacterized protein n=1 Tax=Streblomastix strix TaxID=222440 RepID=A0A5J4TQT5_9EUKA|nr:MAG: hypothetical protein EZS28_043618 [Streblomastix strix]